MSRTRSALFAPFLVTTLVAVPALARADDFYKGKTVTIIVGFSPGGGYDLYARALARFIPDHIPGHPTVIVQNMPGAGSLVAVRSLNVTQPKDGTVMVTFDAGTDHPVRRPTGDGESRFSEIRLDRHRHAEFPGLLRIRSQRGEKLGRHDASQGIHPGIGRRREQAITSTARRFAKSSPRPSSRSWASLAAPRCGSPSSAGNSTAIAAP